MLNLYFSIVNNFDYITLYIIMIILALILLNQIVFNLRVLIIFLSIKLLAGSNINLLTLSLLQLSIKRPKIILISKFS